MFLLSRRSVLIAAAVMAVFVSGAFAQTNCVLPSPTPVAPPNGATNLDATVTFQWTAVDGATSYELWASVDGSDFFQGGTSNTNSFTSDVTRGSTVEWYVIAVNSSCRSLESVHFKFTTGGCTGAYTTLIFPADGGTATSPVHFYWAAVTDAVGYRVWIAHKVNGSWDKADWELWDETTLTESQAFLPPNDYAWLVESLFESCDSNYSDYNIFTIPRAANCSAAVPQISNPPNGSQAKSPLTLRWTGVPNAANYEVWASLDHGETDFVGSTAQTSMDVWAGVGHIEWYVVAQFNGCDDAQSATASFDVPYDPACDHAAPYPIVPADGLNNAPTTLDFIWTPVDGAVKYNVWISVNGGDPYILGSSTTTRLSGAQVQAGEIAWAVEAEFNGCDTTISPVSTFTAVPGGACTTPAAPDIFISPAANSDDPYYVLWSPGLNTAGFEIQESTDPTFASTATRTVNDVLVSFSHQVTAPTRYYYRVRSSSSCQAGGIGPYSQTASIVVRPLVAQTGGRAGTIAAYGNQQGVVQKIHIPGSSAQASFSATTDKPWLTVTPSSGTIPPEGIDLILTGDPRKLPVGTNTGTVHVTTTTPSSDSSPSSIPVSISLVTPVSPDTGTSALPNSLIIPAVGHAAGAGTTFESDVRLTNTSAQAIKYLLTYTPTLSDGTKVGQQTSIQVDAGDTIALNDILKNFFGYAADNDSTLGTLEIRPVSSVSGGGTPQGNVTFVSSRTFAVTAGGTYGQYIPGIPFSTFVGNNTPITLSQLINNSAYHTNIGLVEGARENATVHLTVRDAAGNIVSEFDKQLMPGEHQQFALPANIDNGRIDATVTSKSGKVTAYASVLDNRTHDPMLIMPVQTATISANTYVLPGMAETTVGSNWRSDVRLLNEGTSPVTATVEFFEQGSATPLVQTQTINPGQMLAYDEVLKTLFGKSSDTGSLVITTPASSSLVASARTYNATPDGTYGQFIPGLTVADGVGVNDRALQILQVESSDSQTGFRTNIGMVELTGNPVDVEVGTYTPDSKIAAYTTWHLNGNQFMQIPASALGITNAYNARVTLKVINGTGKIGGYGSLIDNRTGDPTYVPAQ